MVREYIRDIALIGKSKEIKGLASFFLFEWQSTLVDSGFVFDSQGWIENAPSKLLNYEKRMMNDYFILHCIFVSLEEGFSEKDFNCCNTPWEKKNISKELQQECKGIIHTVLLERNRSINSS